MSRWNVTHPAPGATVVVIDGSVVFCKNAEDARVLTALVAHGEKAIRNLLGAYLEPGSSMSLGGHEDELCKAIGET